MKLWWKFRQKQTLWARFLFAKYCSNSHPVDATATSNSSNTWKRMIQVKNLVEPHVKWIVGNGNVDAYKDSWTSYTITHNFPFAALKSFFLNDGSPNTKYIRDNFVQACLEK